MQGLAVFTGHQGRKLYQPGRRVRRQGLDDRVAAGPPPQRSERFEHRVIRFHAAVALQALPAREAQARHLRHGLLLEGVDQSGFANAWFSGDKDELPLALQGLVQTRAQRLQHARASHQMAVCWGHRGRGRHRRTVVDRGDEAVPASGQRLNKPRGLRPVS